MPHKHKIQGKWTGKWFGQIKKNGGRTRKLFDTKDEARAWEVDMKRGVVEPKQPEPTKTATTSLIEWVNRYLDYSLRHVPKVYSEKRNILKRLVQALGKDMPVDSITAGRVLEHLDRQFRERSGHAANKERKNLIAAWKWGVDFIPGFPNVNPFRAVPEYPKDAHPTYVPSEADFWRVVDVAEGQDRVLLLALMETAARRGELYRLRWEDVNFDNRTIRLGTRKRKTGSLEYDLMDMEEELYAALREHHQTAGTEWVFTQSVGRHKGKPYTENRGFPQDLCEKAGVKPFGTKGIRHLSASVLAKHNIAMVEIQGHLRHKKLATTERYVHRQGAGKAHLKVLEGGFPKQGSNEGSNKQRKDSGVSGS